MSMDLKAGAEPIPGYILQNQLGRGGFGEVWQAAGPGGFHVALKFVVLAEAVAVAELRSLETIKNIRHPHLVAMFGSWQVDNYLIVAMEVAERTLLDRYREAVGQGFAGIPAPEIVEHFLDAARAIDFLNEPRHPSGSGEPQGIQHRDIKPQNILLVGGSAKVADFGLARVLEHSHASHTGSMTPAYAAPEFFNRTTSSQSDQYSLAVTYCHMRGGKLPFNGSHLDIMAGHVFHEPDLSMLPAEERAAVARALAKAPKDRWPSCRAFVKAIGSGGSIDERRSTETPAPNAPIDHTLLTDPSVPRASGIVPEVGVEIPTGSLTKRSRRVVRNAKRIVIGSVLLGMAFCGAILVSAFMEPRPDEDDSPVDPPVQVQPTKNAFPVDPPVDPVSNSNANSDAAKIPVAPSVETVEEAAVMISNEMRTVQHTFLTNFLGMKLVQIPAGEFLMGSPDASVHDDETLQHRVQITKAYYLGTTEVTQGEYETVVGSNPSWFSAKGGGKAKLVGQDTRRNPVESVRWNDAVAFCNKLSEREGLRPCYDLATGAKSDGEGYRLPTEAEWEYACRASTKTRYSFGDDVGNLAEHAWYDKNSGGTTHPVGEKRPNSFALFDMHGNVFEWCGDIYDKGYYRRSPAADPPGPHGASLRVLRGGGWLSGPLTAQSSSRSTAPGFPENGQGFRVARTPASR